MKGEFINNKHILIIGTGSVGQRHALNFFDKDCKISCFDPRKDRLEELSSKIAIEKTYTNFDHALQDQTINAAIVCSPTKFHTDQSIKSLEAGWSVLLEKPISINLDDAQTLSLEVKKINKNKQIFLLGYTWRWWKALRKIKELLNAHEIGKVYHAQFFMSANLEDWHPWEPYQEFFMSDKELGGGALLDESHWIDQMLYFFGMPDKILATVDKISNLDITSDDSVELLAYYKEGLKAFIHLDIYGQPHEKSIKIIGEKGAIKWNEHLNTVDLFKGLNFNESFNFSNERNEMFIELANDFLKMLNGENSEIACSIDSGINVMKVIEAARISNRKRSFVNMDEIV